MPKSDLVLLALDAEQALPLFERALAAAAYQVAIVRNAGTMERSLQEAIPALLILSEQFDGQEGLKLAESMLERFPTLPVLLFLNDESPRMLRKALQAGISDVLTPPLKVDAIRTAVEHSLMRARRIGDWTRREVRRSTASLKQRLDETRKLEIIIEHIEEGVIILDESNRVLIINPAARREFGIWRDENVSGRPVLEVLPHPDLKALIAEEKNSPMPHSEFNFGDGRVLGAQFTRIPGIGSAISLQDITYLKHIDRLKTEFVNTVSHDLRSPLTAILGYVELLERVGPLTQQQKEFVTRVTASVQSITALVNDLLELGRIEAGVDSHKETIPLEGIITYTIDTLAAQIAERRQVLKLEIPAKVPPMRGNPIRLRQMLDNLIGNAIKYTPEGGEIGVELEVQDGLLILRVSDSGIGIPPADQPHIFEKFYRASNIPKGVGGSGLGLAIVKSIVENHSGRIWVESISGQGTTFSIVLPANPDDPGRRNPA